MFRPILTVAIFSLCFISVPVFDPARSQETRALFQKQTPETESKKTGSNLKVFAEGFQSSINHPFIAVVRDADAYAELRRLDQNLPVVEADFFDTRVLVAAFLGERNTGGFAVEITQTNEIEIAERKPPRGAMVPQMVTSPFKIVVIDGVIRLPIRILADEAWRRETKIYKVTAGSFTASGGFAGTSDEFKFQGHVAVMREKKLTTLFLRLRGEDQKRLLVDAATGVEHENQVQLPRMSADSFVQSPTSGLRGSAIFSDEERKLSLDLLPRQPYIPDGYIGRGTVEAELSNSSPNRSRAN